ncbi:hypothetical protein [Schlesneria sp. DSM 10557]|uniref:hypothetical protein n=1 Tax=Schlesneria sp. DSM 10557 TaxID=3044399 RepID=UPI0035A156B6
MLQLRQKQQLHQQLRLIRLKPHPTGRENVTGLDVGGDAVTTTADLTVDTKAGDQDEVRDGAPADMGDAGQVRSSTVAASQAGETCIEIISDTRPTRDGGGWGRSGGMAALHRVNLLIEVIAIDLIVISIVTTDRAGEGRSAVDRRIIEVISIATETWDGESSAAIGGHATGSVHVNITGPGEMTMVHIVNSAEIEAPIVVPATSARHLIDLLHGTADSTARPIDPDLARHEGAAFANSLIETVDLTSALHGALIIRTPLTRGGGDADPTGAIVISDRLEVIRTGKDDDMRDTEGDMRGLTSIITSVDFVAERDTDSVVAQ